MRPMQANRIATHDISFEAKNKGKDSYFMTVLLPSSGLQKYFQIQIFSIFIADSTH